MTELKLEKYTDLQRNYNIPTKLTLCKKNRRRKCSKMIETKLQVSQKQNKVNNRN